MKKLIFPIAALLLLASCGKSKEVINLEKSNDSLVVLNNQAKAEFDELISTLNMVEDGFSQIKEKENYLVDQSKSNNDLSKSTKERLRDDITLINETLQANREKIQKLQRLYNSSKNKSEELKKMIEGLQQQIEEKSATIAQLQQELGKKDAQIKELNLNVESLTNESTSQKAVMAAQDAALNTAFYIVGTKKQLKADQVISGGGLFSSLKVMKGDVNEDLFTKIDVRNVKQIVLNTKEKAKVLTNMPADSYTITPSTDGTMLLQIGDIEKFWSKSKYLVVQIN